MIPDFFNNLVATLVFNNLGATHSNVISSRPGKPHQAFCERKIKLLTEFNNNPNIVYPCDMPDGVSVDSYTASLAKINFECQNNSLYEIKYIGSDPAEDLQALQKLTPLILDCRVSLALIDHLILLETVGKVQFNTMFRENFNPFQSHPFCDQVVYQQCPQSMHENTPDKVDLQIGDAVYIMGNPAAFGFKPTSISNAYNLIYVGFDSNQEPLLKGFRSNGDKVFTYKDMLEFLDEKLREPLSIGDVEFIHHQYLNNPDKYPFHCHLTWKEIFESFDTKTKSQIVARLRDNPTNSRKEDSHINKKTPTDITVPDTILNNLPSLGVVVKHRYNNISSKAIYEGDLKRAYGQVKTTHHYPSMDVKQKNNSPFSDPNFIKTEYYQKDLEKVIGKFCNEAISDESLSAGLLVYGDTGTGKTHLCQYAKEWLENQGKKVLTIQYDQPMLTSKQFTEYLQMDIKHRSSEKRNLGIIDHLRTELDLDKHDIIYIDDVNQSTSEHSFVTQALIQYAEKNHKKILINSNNHPSVFTGRQTDLFYTNLRVFEVRGDDFRVQNAWHTGLEKTTLPEGKRQKLTIDHYTATPDQYTIIDMIETLNKQTTPSGIIVAGHPGTGKTTAVKHALTDKKHLYISSSSIDTFKLEKLKDSDIRFLVIEDVNETSWRNRRHQEVFAKLCNADDQTLTNKKDEAIKIILITNSIDGDLIQQYQDDREFKTLYPRMRSRYDTRFYKPELSSTEDMRKFDKDSQLYFVTTQPKELPDDSLNLNVDTFISRLTEISNSYRSNSFALFDKTTSEVEKGHYDTTYRKGINSQAKESTSIVLDFRNYSLDRLHAFSFASTEFCHFLDIMEDEKIPLYLIHPEPQELLYRLTTHIENAFSSNSAECNKYLSRLNNNSLKTMTAWTISEQPSTLGEVLSESVKQPAIGP